MTEFVHLHVHSDFSLQDAAVSVTALADRAAELGMTHLALTDHGNMFGAMGFIKACKETVVAEIESESEDEKEEKEEKHAERKNPITPIIGCEVYVSPGSRFEKKGAEHENKYYHLILLVSNREGYFNLVKLCSYAYTEGFYYRPRIDEELLSKYHGGLIALSACVSGEIPRLIQAGKKDEAQEKALYYRDLFGKDADGNPNFYLEIQDHGIPANYLRTSDLSQKEINESVVDISKKTGIPLVATNDVHYLDREDYVAHDILLCVGTGKQRTEEKRKKYYGDQFYFKTGDEMAELFSEYPDAIRNTVLIARRCNADIPNISVKELPKYLPDFAIPDGFESADHYLRHLAEEGLAIRYAKEREAGGEKWKEIQKRSEYELETIINMGFTGYILIVADFINFAKERGIPVGPGRGSGAGSIVAYSLRITDIDPLKYNLFFERFLNPERISMPDFDIDFANEGREDVIRYVTEKYGKDKVGQIITFGTLGAKAVIKDVARVLGISISDSEMITKLIPKDPKITLDGAFENEPKLQEFKDDPRYTELFELAHKLEGLHRHSSIHAAGVVIGRQPLIDLVPLYQERGDSKTGKAGGIATQYTWKYLEPCGLVKMDFLGIKTLDVIKHTQELIRRRAGNYSAFNIENIPEDDKATFKMLGEGKSFEVFQFASDGMQNILKQTKPDSIEDLIALNAMYRPGPMQNIPRFVNCKNGKEPITYPDPSLKPILKETYGVIVYQEQVMEVAKTIAGYTMGQADMLRRAMGKKEKELIKKEKIPFIEGAKKNGYSEETAGVIYDILVPFADYGFNKSHSAAYAIIAYQTAYLKANFPAEFMAANLTNEIHSADKDMLSKCIDEARRMDIEVVPPDINKSDKIFSVVDGKIVFGFLGIKGLGETSAEEIVRGREEGKYKNFIDFLDRVDIKIVGKKVIELLIQTGAFDCFGITRETLLGNIERAVEYISKKKEDEKFGQTNLFDDASENIVPEFTFEEQPLMSKTDKLTFEKNLLGFYFSGHPMDEYRDVWEKAVKINLGQPESLKMGKYVLVGVIKNFRQVITKSGGRMAYGFLEDYNGEIEITFFPGVWDKCRDIIKPDNVAILQGKIENKREKISFIVDNCINKGEVDAVIKEMESHNQKNEMYKNTWAYMADLKSSQILSAKKGNYTVIGYLKSMREIKDRNGNEMAFGTLEDFEGEIDLVFFSRMYGENKSLLNLNEIIALKGSIDPENEQNGKISLKVSSIANFVQLSRSAAKKITSGEAPPEIVIEAPPVVKKIDQIHIRLAENAANSAGNMLALSDFLAANSGNNPVFIYVPTNEGDKKIRADSGIDIFDGENPDEVIKKIEKIECVARAWRE